MKTNHVKVVKQPYSEHRDILHRLGQRILPMQEASKTTWDGTFAKMKHTQDAAVIWQHSEPA